MEKINEHKYKIIIVLLIFIFINNCSNNSKINKLSVKLDSLNAKIISTKEIEKIIIKEGLKTEKRMIQSTDRKLLDVNRQKEIDDELKKIN